MNIFIEHYSEQTEFAEILAKRIKSIKGTNIKTYNDLCVENEDIENVELFKELENYDIIIPIVADNYISNEAMNEKFEQFSDSKDKILLPIIYDDSQWSSISWIVKSKVFPESGSPFKDLDEKSKVVTINKLLNTIETIISQKVGSEKDQEINFQTKENIVFISHSHEDADFAELLKLQLEKNGIKGWIDGEKLKIGQDWRQEIDEGIIKSIALIVIMTPDAKNSEYVTYEWAFGWGKQIPVFPVMLKQTPLHPRLESLQYLDFTNRLTRPWQKLIDSIKALEK
jgi:hypothetical protein